MSKRLLYGKGINDSEEFVRTNKKLDPIYSQWANMMCRCFSEKYKRRRSLCNGCTVCDDWLVFSNFKKWCKDVGNGYISGYCLDKDLILSGNKHYCPETCCFVPNEINTIINKQKRQRGTLPIGVTKDKKRNKYCAQISKHKKNVHIGTFNSPEDAYAAYKKEKESYVKEIARKYYISGSITQRVYDALMQYEININD